MNKPLSDRYTINIIKEEINAKKFINIKGYIRVLAPRYILTDEIKNKIQKLIEIEISKINSISLTSP